MKIKMIVTFDCEGELSQRGYEDIIQQYLSLRVSQRGGKEFTVKLESVEAAEYMQNIVIRINKEATDKIGQLQAEIKRRDEALENMCCQYCTTMIKDGQLCLSHDFMGAGEEAFRILGWKDPHPIPDMRQCQHEGCCKEATCGTPTKDGYKLLCGEHFDKVPLQELREN